MGLERITSKLRDEKVVTLYAALKEADMALTAHRMAKYGIDAEANPLYRLAYKEAEMVGLGAIDFLEYHVSAAITGLLGQQSDPVINPKTYLLAASIGHGVGIIMNLYALLTE